MEPIESQWVSLDQRGFVRGRPMHAKFLEVERAAMEMAMGNDDSAMLLFDYTAAFPSVAHVSRWAELENAGIPQRWIVAIRLLYIGNRHYMRGKDKRKWAFYARGGVRQGCPLSPFLFIIVMTVLMDQARGYLSAETLLQLFKGSNCLTSFMPTTR